MIEILKFKMKCLSGALFNSNLLYFWLTPTSFFKPPIYCDSGQATIWPQLPRRFLNWKRQELTRSFSLSIDDFHEKNVIRRRYRRAFLKLLYDSPISKFRRFELSRSLDSFRLNLQYLPSFDVILAVA
ncbi:hypothetical protein SADUNF_Sadunf02G0106400 [Salix dunnii]|uniref:Uncharacterized protein n=1 Tax=Salix dunnii TaxID=1413687 RepID=A0A835N789_9ROSI|nr:hypothetical protein SADUNF_Sadunf02G0106400 [Salix dunnii]